MIVQVAEFETRREMNKWLEANAKEIRVRQVFKDGSYWIVVYATGF